MATRKRSYENHGLHGPVQASASLSLTLRILAGAAIIAVVVFLAYFPSISGGFVWDDKLLLSESEIVRDSDGLYRLWCTTEAADYWPVTNSTFWLEWRLWGMNPTGYHVANLVLHVVESVLIWVILRKLSLPGALLAAMVFAVHPVNVESVAWISQLKNTMAMLFFLLSILWYLKADIARSHGGPRVRKSDLLHPSSFIPLPSSFYWLSLSAFGLAMLGKGSVAILPLLLLGITWWLRPLTQRDLARIAPFFLLAVVLTGANIWFQTHGEQTEMRDAGLLERLLAAGCVPWFYLYKALLPIDLAFIYPQWRIDAGDLKWWLPLSAAIAATAMLWWCRKGWSRPMLFAWGFFCVSLVPVMGFTRVGFMKYSLVADHYQHMAIIGLIALVASARALWRRRARMMGRQATTAAVLAVGVLAFLTWRQNAIYHDAVTLHQATLRENPGCWLAHYNLGLALANAGLLPEAIEHYEQALRVKPDYNIARNNLGLALAKSGRLQEAIENYRQALRLDPAYVNARLNLGVVLATTGQLPEAIEELEQAMRLEPDNAEIHFNLGLALTGAGRLPEAVEHYRQALRLKPDYADACLNLGAALAMSGRLQEAVESYQQALRLRPDYASARVNLGIALAQTGRHKEAIEQFGQALRIDPNFANAYYNMALNYERMQRPSEAVAAAKKALSLAVSQGRTGQAKQIEDWLKSHSVSAPDRPETPASRQSSSSPP